MSPSDSLSPSAHFPFGYRAYLFPGFLRSDEEGLSSCLKCPCIRAVANTPSEESASLVSLRPFLLSSLTFKQLDFRILRLSRLLCVHGRYGPVTRSPPFRWLCQQTPDSSFPPCLLSKLRGSDFFPGGLPSSPLNISALPGRAKCRRSKALESLLRVTLRDSSCLFAPFERYSLSLRRLRGSVPYHRVVKPMPT